MENNVLLQSFLSLVTIIACSRVNLSRDLSKSLQLMNLLMTKMQAGTQRPYTTGRCLFVSPPNVTFNITGGTVNGLIRPGLKIRDYCSAPGWIGSEVTIGCYGFFNSVDVHFLGVAAVNNTAHNVSFNATLASSIDVLVELAAEPGDRARLRTWLVQPLKVGVNPQYPQSLSSTMTADQLEAVNRSFSNCAADRIYEVLMQDYKDQLAQVVSGPSIDIPLPSL